MYQPTPSQRALKQSAIAGIVTALATITAAAYQYGLGHGFNVPALLGFLAPFVTAQAVTLFHVLLSSPQAKQAELDTLTNLPAEIKALPGLLASVEQGIHSKLDALLSRPTVIAATTTPVPTASTAIMPSAVQNMTAAADMTTSINPQFRPPVQVAQQPFPNAPSATFPTVVPTTTTPQG